MNINILIIFKNFECVSAYRWRHYKIDFWISVNTLKNIDACKDHGGMNLAAHTSIGVIMKARNCAHRKSIESSYLQVHVPRGKCELNIQLGNNGAANMQ